MLGMFVFTNVSCAQQTAEPEKAAVAKPAAQPAKAKAAETPAAVETVQPAPQEELAYLKVEAASVSGF